MQVKVGCVGVRQVTVWVHPALARFLSGDYRTFSGGEISICLGEEASVRELLDFLELPRGLAELIVVNGEVARADTIIPASAHVRIYPIFGGG